MMVGFRAGFLSGAIGGAPIAFDATGIARRNLGLGSSTRRKIALSLSRIKPALDPFRLARSRITQALGALLNRA